MAEGEAFEQELEKQSLAGNLLFTSETTSASVLGETLAGKYSREWLEWSPATLRSTVERDFTTEIHPVAWEKIMAVQVLLLTDDVWQEWQVFVPVVKALNNQIPNFTMAAECSPGELAWAVTEMAKIREEPFGDEVTLFVRASCLSHGLVLFPAELAFAQGPLGAEESRLAALWAEKSKQLNFPVTESADDVQLARLNSIRHYLRAMAGESEKVVLQHEGKW
ncbi:MAG: hypothetical protein ABFE07_29635 [Armatimonadia bacterium]